MSKEFDKENNVFNGNHISFMRPRKDTKVMIWGYELCNGADWKDFLDAVNKLGKEKTDLEAKLAEKDLRIEELESQFAYECECNKQFVECQKENEKLKQQLAEKDKEIEFVKHEREANGASYISACKMLTKERKDKISFWIEQLEKLKKTDVVCMNRNGNVYILGSSLNEAIDNQIEELKKEIK